MLVTRLSRCSCVSLFGARTISSSARESVPRRSLLYVPASSPKMLQKSLSLKVDCIAYDLEDSVAHDRKAEARSALVDFLNSDSKPDAEVAVRINSIGSGFEEEDLRKILATRNIETIALPKSDDAEHIEYVKSAIQRYGQQRRIRIIGMIESAEAVVKLRDIAASGKGHLDALLFAAEDYCASLGIKRSPSLVELLYARSAVVTVAKAYGLQSLDMVCTDFKAGESLKRECEEGMRMGFDGKQAIHPMQIEAIHEFFSPTAEEVEQATRIERAYLSHSKEGRGAFGLDGKMIDAPVLKQALATLAKARR